MIKVKIISKEEAIRLGLSNTNKKKSGGGEMGGGGIIKVDKETGKQETFESFIFKENGDKEITFMHEDRKKDLKNSNGLRGYLSQFTKMPKELQDELLD